MSSTKTPSPPANLPSAFRATPVEWKAVTFPAPKRGANYVTRGLEKESASPRRPLPPGARSKRPVASTIEARPDQTRVLICDPNIEQRAVVEECLLAWGFQVTPAASVDEAESHFDGAAMAPHILMVASDAGAGRRGVEWAQSCARRVPDLEVIFMGTVTEISFALDAKSSRIHEFVLRPMLQTESLRAAVANACSRVHEKLYLALLVGEFDKMHRRMEIEARISAELSEHVELSKVLQIGCRGLSELFDDCAAVFLQYVPRTNALAVTARFPESLFAGAQPSFTLPFEGGRDMAKLRDALGRMEGNADMARAFEQASTMSPELLAGFEETPWRTAVVETRGIPRGVFAVLTKSWNEKADPFRLSRVAQNLSKSYELAVLHAKMADVSTQDAFTGLLNAKYLSRRLGDEVKKASRLKHPLSLAVIELDEAHLKKGSSALARAAQKIREAFRATDLVGLAGDNAFAVLMPHTSFVDALKKCEMLRGRWLAEGLTTGWGVAECPGHASTAEELMFAAEAAAREALESPVTGVQIAAARPGYVPPFLPDSPRSARSSEL